MNLLAKLQLDRMAQALTDAHDFRSLNRAWGRAVDEYAAALERFVFFIKLGGSPR